MIQIKPGNILDVEAGIIVQQVSCKGVMGAGLAKQLREKYPGLYSSYLRFIEDWSECSLGKCHIYQASEHLLIANCFGQAAYGRGALQTNYTALRTALETIAARYPYHSISIPWGLGCGLAGGDWTRTMGIILNVFRDSDIIIHYRFR